VERLGRVPPFRLSAIPPLLRRLAGMPDYDAHVEHLRRCHPDQPLPSRREFFEAYVAARYGAGPTRCC
jgi:uncharacterized short protein YbdD (DUF466 family)